jgi:uncharacterized protein (TIGR03437 family)
MKRVLGISSLFIAVATAQAASYIVVLKDRAVAEGGERAQIARSQAPVEAMLRQRGIRVNGESHVLLNALFVDADPAELSAIRALPGVAYVQREQRFELLLDRAEQLINVPAAWSALGGMVNAGAGMKIAVIDTGIEATHPAFQDKSMTAPAGFPQCGVYQMPLVALNCAQFTNSKVIVARSYVPQVAAGTGASPAATSRPDDITPRDRVGHGTAVAMAAAGAMNAGPADTITGVAPKAWLGSYKVFGSPGLNDFTSTRGGLAALSDAFSDGMDVAVLSLGGPAFSGPDDNGAICGLPAGQACDVWATAVKNAVNGGMVVVIAAGNAGQNGVIVQPTLGTINTPGIAPAAITVGATTNSHSWSNPLTVNGLGLFHSLLGSGPAPNPSLAAPLADAVNVTDSMACNAAPAGSLNGAYVLVDRGVCTFAQKVQNLQSGGAAGVIITNSVGDDSVLVPGGLGGGATSIPATFIGYDDGVAIRAHLQNNGFATAMMGTALSPYDVTTGNQAAGFTSRGPVLATGALKPDISAPGTDLYLAAQTYDPNGALYGANGYVVSQGTSFAAPLVAGVAALVKQANPSLSAARIKSAVVNTATQDVTDAGAPASVLAMGAGKANAGAAVGANVVAEPATASFGIVQAGKLPVNIPIQLTNVGNSSVSLTVALNRRTAENTAKTSIDRPSLTLAAGQTNTVNLTLSGTAPDPGLYEGFVTVTGGSSTVSIPYLFVAGDGVPYNIVPVAGSGDDGTVNGANAQGALVLQLLDRYGVPVPNAPVRWSVASGGGSVRIQDLATDIYGFAGAVVRLGPDPGTNEFLAVTAGLATSFDVTARPQPAITPQGVVNAASFQQSAAPGSYIAIFGSALADGTQINGTPYLEVALNKTSVSFDTPAGSYPGHLHFVTPGQVNVQVPWELQGQTSVQMKVTVQDSFGSLYTLPLSAYAPGIFEYSAAGVNYAAARDENFALITTSNPARAGHTIQIYCNGLGPVSNQPASGDPASGTQLSYTNATVTATIGGKDAPVSFSGLTPTTVGLYQVNVTVPSGMGGVLPVTVNVGGVTSVESKIAVQ